MAAHNARVVRRIEYVQKDDIPPFGIEEPAKDKLSQEHNDLINYFTLTRIKLAKGELSDKLQKELDEIIARNESVSEIETLRKKVITKEAPIEDYYDAIVRHRGRIVDALDKQREERENSGKSDDEVTNQEPSEHIIEPVYSPDVPKKDFEKIREMEKGNAERNIETSDVPTIELQSNTGEGFRR